MLTSHAYGQRWIDMHASSPPRQALGHTSSPTTARTTSTSSTRTSSQPRHVPSWPPSLRRTRTVERGPAHHRCRRLAQPGATVRRRSRAGRRPDLPMTPRLHRAAFRLLLRWRAHCQRLQLWCAGKGGHRADLSTPSQFHAARSLGSTADPDALQDERVAADRRGDGTWLQLDFLRRAPKPTRAEIVREIRDVVADLPRFATAPLYRRWHQRWGATDEEVAAAMPGDDLIQRPQYRCHWRALTIAAPPKPCGCGW
jgi:hypothetical protein